MREKNKPDCNSLSAVREVSLDLCEEESMQILCACMPGVRGILEACRNKGSGVEGI